MTFSDALLLIGTGNPIRTADGRTGEIVGLGTGWTGDETATIRWHDDASETTTHVSQIEEATDETVSCNRLPAA